VSIAFEKITASPRRLLAAVLLFIALDLSILLINLWIAHQVALDAVAINLAGRQRMLSQRITKATLIAAEQPRTPLGEQAREELDTAYLLFTRTLHAFDRGGETLGGDGQVVTLRPVSAPKGRQAIKPCWGIGKAASIGTRVSRAATWRPCRISGSSWSTTTFWCWTR